MSVADYVEQNQERFEQELFRLLEIPSVSTDPARTDAVLHCAQEVAVQMRHAGLEHVEVMATGGHPLVYGQWLHAQNAPTVLIYGHYDVQPEDPVAEWTSPPFKPTVREGKVYARGATDDKGQMIAHIKAVEALLQSEGKLPVNVKFVIEGEEEIGSCHLRAFLEKHRELLKSDVLVVSDSAMFAPGQPSIVYGLRGLTFVQVELKGADSDLHSGVFGGAVPNPGFELCKLIASLKDSDGRITVAGFYDKVRDLSVLEREDYARLPFDQEQFRKELNVNGLIGEKGWTPLECRSARPTLEVNGMLCGWTGPGAKTVLPARAMAKISCRLVPDQDPEEITRLLVDHIKTVCSPAVECVVHPLHGAKPWITPRQHPALECANRAVQTIFGKEALFVREGGSIPIVVDFHNILGIPGLLVGFGLDSENLHAPNEHFDLSNYQLGIRLSVELMRELVHYKA